MQPIHTFPSYPFEIIFSNIHPYTLNPSDTVPSATLSITLDAFLTCTMHAACLNHLILLDLIMPIVLRLSHLGHSGDQIKADEMGRVCGMHGGKEKCIKVLVENVEGKRPPESLRHRWKDNIKIGLQETGWEGMDWFHLAQDRDKRQDLVNMVMNPQVP
jgi:hypothetical protein